MKKVLIIAFSLLVLLTSCEQHVHTWDNGTVTTAATCTTEGVKTFKCTGCDETKTESIPKVANHSFDTAWTSDADNHWHAATCGCTSEQSDLAVHTWDEGEITTPATCAAEGVKTYTCTVCSETKTESIAKVDHTWGIGVIDKDTMKETFECSVCGETKEEDVEGDVYAVKFVYNSYLTEYSDVTIYYRSGEKIVDRGPENGYEEYNIFDWWVSPLSYKIKVTSETVVNKDMKIVEYPNGGFVFFYDTDDNIVNVLGPYPFSQWHTIEAGDLPEVPAIEGYQGYWMGAEEGLRRYFTDEMYKFYSEVHPWYTSEAKWESTGMPKSIIQTNGTKFWIHSSPVNGISPIKLVDNTNVSKSLCVFGYSDLQMMYNWFGSNSEARTAFTKLDTKAKMDFMIEKVTEKSQIIHLVGSIKSLRDSSDNKTWCLPTTSEIGYIWDVLYRNAKDSNATKGLLDLLSRGDTTMYFFTMSGCGSYQTSSSYAHYLYEVNTETGSNSTVASNAVSSGGYLWLISFEPIDK